MVVSSVSSPGDGDSKRAQDEASQKSMIWLPVEIWDEIASYLSVTDLVRLSMVNKPLGRIARSHRLKDRSPIVTRQVGVDKVWPHLPFEDGMEYAHHDGQVVCSLCVIAGYLFTGSIDMMARKIDVLTGQLLWECEHGGRVLSMCSDGKHLFTGSIDKMARKIDVGTGAVLMQYPHMSKVLCVCVSDNGPNLYTGSGGMVRKIDASTGKVSWECKLGRAVLCCCVRGDYLFAGRGSGTDVVNRIDVDTGRVLWGCDHMGPVLSVFSNGRYLYTGSVDERARKIDADSGEVLMEYQHEGSVNAVYVCDGCLLSSNPARPEYTIDVKTGKAFCIRNMARKIDVETGAVLKHYQHQMEYPMSDPNLGYAVSSVFVSESDGYLYTVSHGLARAFKV